MKHRKIVLKIIFICLPLAFLLLLAPVRYVVLGFFRGEPFYQGMPASYWRDKILQWEEAQKLDGFDARCADGERQASSPSYRFYCWVEETVPILKPHRPVAPVLDKPEAIPVLMALLLDPQVGTTVFVKFRLIGEPTVPVLLQRLRDHPNPKARYDALCVVNSLLRQDGSGLSNEAIAKIHQGILAATSDPDLSISLEAYCMLPRYDLTATTRCVRAVLELYPRLDANLRYEALGILAHFHTEEIDQVWRDDIVRTIRRALEDEDLEVRQGARSCLKWLMLDEP